MLLLFLSGRRVSSNRIGRAVNNQKQRRPLLIHRVSASDSGRHCDSVQPGILSRVLATRSAIGPASPSPTTLVWCSTPGSAGWSSGSGPPRTSWPRRTPDDPRHQPLAGGGTAPPWGQIESTIIGGTGYVRRTTTLARNTATGAARPGGKVGLTPRSGSRPGPASLGGREHGAGCRRAGLGQHAAVTSFSRPRCSRYQKRSRRLLGPEIVRENDVRRRSKTCCRPPSRGPPWCRSPACRSR